jgi:hypothetical protein
LGTTGAGRLMGMGMQMNTVHLLVSFVQDIGSKRLGEKSPSMVSMRLSLSACAIPPVGLNLYIPEHLQQ